MVAPIPAGDLRGRRYVDVEAVLVGWMTAALADLDVRISTELPAADQLMTALAEYAGYVQVEAFAGADHDPAQETVSVDVDVYVAEDADGNPNRAGAADLAELIRAAMLLYLPGYTTGDGTATVTAVATLTRPCARPYDANEALRRFSAAYQVTVQSRG